MTSLKRVEQSGIDTSVSVKLTQLGLSFDKDQCVRHLEGLASAARSVGKKTLEIDMERISQYVTTPSSISPATV